MPKFKDLTGRVYGKLTVQALAGYNHYGKFKWKCQCECGGITVLNRASLYEAAKRGQISSCGCLQIIALKKAQRNSITHGLSHSPTHRCWKGMIQRCFNSKNPSFKNYGGRGITVSFKWRKFEGFLADMGLRPSLKHSIERKNVNGNYSKANCIWATPSQQMRNTRVNRLVTWSGKTQPLAAWAEEWQLRYEMIRSRLRKFNWDETKAFSTWIELAHARSVG